MLGTSAIILANEMVKGFSKDKGTMLIDNKALIRHVFDAVNPVVDEVIIVTSTQERMHEYAKFLPKTVKFITTDNNQQQSPSLLNGAITGLEIAQGKYALLLPYDAPLFSRELAIFLLDLAIGKMAAVPRSSKNEIEPLCSAYQTKAVLEIAKQVVAEDMMADLFVLVEKLRGVRYISMSVIEQMDLEMKTFFRINTPLDIKRATVMLQGKNKQQYRKRK